MLKLGVIIPLLLIVLKILAQEPVYFNNIYNPVNTYAAGRGILQVGNMYYGIFGTWEAPNYYYKLGVFKMDQTGDITEWNLFGENGHDYFAGSVGGTLIYTNDGNFAFSCHVQGPDSVYGTLVKLNTSLETIWQRNYSTEHEITMTIKVKQTSDGGYIIVGQAYPGTGSFLDALMIKTDNMGLEEWHKIYGINSNASEYGTDVIETLDGGYLVGGMKDIQAIDHSLNAMVIKTDSLGNQEWVKYYGNPNVDDDMALLALTDDGNYLVAMVYGDEIFAPTARSGRIYLIKIDNNGNPVWEKKIGQNRINIWIKNFRTTSNGYILSGFSYETDSSTFQYNSGWMMKVDKDLDSVWYRDYIHQDENWESFFYDAYPTNDNGYIAIGKARPDMGGENNMWIVKVDSMGCDTPGCITTVISEELIVNSMKGLRVWPNPCREKVWITYINHPFRGDERGVMVYNSHGVKVEEIRIPENSETIQIDVNRYQKGLYYLRYFHSDKTIETVKFIRN